MSLTCVSCYYRVKNKHDDHYLEWFQNTLSIQCPYVLFGNKESITILKQFRNEENTLYIEYNIEDFMTYPYKDKMVTHPRHCPSIELNLIWNEKIFMIQKARQMNPFQSEWFHWIDAGICTFRDTKPPHRVFPSAEKLKELDSFKELFLFSSSNAFIPEYITPHQYYHCISGTYVIHKDRVERFANLYREYLEKCVDKNKDNIWTDQVIWTHIYKDYPQLFMKLCDGYGEVTKYLFL